MIGEVASTIAKASLELAKETAKEVGKEVAGRAVDIGKRIDISKKAIEIGSSKVDISKRIRPEAAAEISGKDITQTVKAYIDDLKSKSLFPDTIKSLDNAKLEIQSPERIKQLRLEFIKNRSEIRKAWEALNHKEWPKYTEDVERNGIKIRKAGDYYDGHHTQSLKLGGTNDASNITPLDINNHLEIHSKLGSCTKLLEKIEGIAKV